MSARWPLSARPAPAFGRDLLLFVDMLGAVGVAALRVHCPAARVPVHLDRQPVRPRGLAGRAHHSAHHLPDRRHHRPARHLPFPQIRRRALRRRPGRHPRAARDRRLDRRHHGRRPLGQLLHRRARLHEDARGDRRAAYHGLRSDRGADPAPHPRPDRRPARADLSRLHGGALRRRPGGLALWGHQSRHLSSRG